MSEQKILISGQVNFFKAFIGTINATDGTFIDSYLLSSTDTTYRVGYTTNAINFDSSGNIFAGIYFLGSAASIIKLIPNQILPNGNVKSGYLSWKKALTDDSVVGN